MTTLLPDHQEFIALLNAHSVKYLLIGGYAVIHYGYLRTTGDIDFFIETSEENARKMSLVIQDFFGLSAPPDHLQFTRPEMVFYYGLFPNRIEILTGISGVTFDDCWKSKSIVTLSENIKTNIISLEDLLKNKKASGRAKDTADIEELSGNF